MTNAECWARVVQARTRHDDLRLWTLRNSGHEAVADLGAAPSIGAELVLLVHRAAPITLGPVARAGGVVWRDCGHAREVRAKGWA